MKIFNSSHLKGFIPISTVGVGGYISYQASNKDTITKLEMAKLRGGNQTEFPRGGLQIESASGNERIKLQELVIKHGGEELDLKIIPKELDLKYPAPGADFNSIGGAPAPKFYGGPPEGSSPAPPILEASNSPAPLNLGGGGLATDSNTGGGGGEHPPINNGEPGGQLLMSPFENWWDALSECINAIDDYIETLSRVQLLGLSFLLYIGVIIWCFSWIIVYSYLSRKTIDWGEKYGNNQLIILIMNIVRFSSVGLGYIYICTIFLCLGLSGGLACYIFING